MKIVKRNLYPLLVAIVTCHVVLFDLKSISSHFCSAHEKVKLLAKITIVNFTFIMFTSIYETNPLQLEGNLLM